MGRKPKLHLFKGKMLTSAEIALTTGLSISAVRTRIANGIPLDKEVRINKYEYQGKMYTIKELSEISGIIPTTLKYRITKKGMTAEQAIHIGQKRNGTPYGETIETVILKAWDRGEKTVAEIAEETGISEGEINNVLPVMALNADENAAKRAVLKKYGY